jgi:pyruvate dehydrogenase phosphatase
LQEYWGRQCPANFKSPPYVTAEPVVTTTTLSPADTKDAFIVMGTDGLWEKLTNEEVVGLVGKWLDKKNGTEKPSWFTKQSSEFNVAEAQEYEGAKKPGKRSNKWVWQDGNAATHLIRNALGGGNLDEVSFFLYGANQ